MAVAAPAVAGATFEGADGGAAGVTAGARATIDAESPGPGSRDRVTATPTAPPIAMIAAASFHSPGARSDGARLTAARCRGGQRSRDAERARGRAPALTGRAIARR